MSTPTPTECPICKDGSGLYRAVGALNCDNCGWFEGQDKR